VRNLFSAGFLAQIENAIFGGFLHEERCNQDWGCDEHINPHGEPPVVVVFSDDVGSGKRA
jgi:hypothetical protein